ncbi:MAG: hypothetical protein NUV91_08220 [Candidatus Omnitrophica bacterium]|nr:hypothetical protein [Candidatus Omnitrophota bacterium]
MANTDKKHRPFLWVKMVFLLILILSLVLFIMIPMTINFGNKMLLYEPDYHCPTAESYRIVKKGESPWPVESSWLVNIRFRLKPCLHLMIDVIPPQPWGGLHTETLEREAIINQTYNSVILQENQSWWGDREDSPDVESEELPEPETNPNMEVLNAEYYPMPWN